MLDEYKILVEKSMAIWNEEKIELIDELFHPDFMAEAPDTLNLNEFFGWLNNLYTAYSDMHFAIDDRFMADDKIVIRWTMTAKHTGMLGEFEPTNREIEIPGVTIYQLKDKLIYRMWAFYNFYLVMMQLGLTNRQKLEPAPV